MKRRSVSKARQPESPVFFLDRNFGSKIVAQVLRGAGEQVEIHDDHFAQDAQDPEWLTKVGERGWIVLTTDERIRYRPNEKLALLNAKVRAFVFVSQNMRAEEKAQSLLAAIPAIKRIASGHTPPFIAKIYKDGRVEMWVTEEELKKDKI